MPHRSPSPYRSRHRHSPHSRTRSRRRHHPPRFPHRLHSLSSSRERSRERERERRKAQAECIRLSGGFKKLADSVNHDTVRLFWDGFQWVAKTGQTSNLQSDPALMNSTRKLRRLYFGNLPLHLGLTETGFQDIVWQEMRQRNFCNQPDVNPVLYVWFAKDKGNYGFVEFATVEETEKALTMDGMNCMGIPLKVSRPNDYSTATVSQNQAMANMGQQAAAALIGGALTEDGNSIVNNNTMGPGTSRYIKLLEVIYPNELSGNEEYADILEDILSVCAKSGTITNSVIITPNNVQPPYSVGDVFLEFLSAAEADQCITLTKGRKYFGRQINIMRSTEVPFQELKAIM